MAALDTRHEAGHAVAQVGQPVRPANIRLQRLDVLGPGIVGMDDGRLHGSRRLAAPGRERETEQAERASNHGADGRDERLGLADVLGQQAGEPGHRPFR